MLRNSSRRPVGLPLGPWDGLLSTGPSLDPLLNLQNRESSRADTLTAVADHAAGLAMAGAYKADSCVEEVLWRAAAACSATEIASQAIVLFGLGPAGN